MASGEKRAAEKSDWTAKEMPEKHTTIQLNVGFKEEEMEQIKMGFIPEEMEEKWFIYYVQDENKLYLHRSWTGFCIYIVKFEKIEGGYAAVNAVVNRDSSQYTCENDEQDKDTCLMVIGAILLGQFGTVGSPLESWALLGKHSLTPNAN